MFLLDRMLRRIVKQGELTVVDSRGRTYRYGSPKLGQAAISIRFKDRFAPGFIARHPRLGIGEAYMDGRVTVEQGDILALIDLVRSNVPWERGGGIGSSPFKRSARRLVGTLGRLNTLARARRNVAHHYDLDDRHYGLFLDHDRQYSCAYFEPGNSDLDRAQAAKLAHIAGKLALRPGQRVLDIGCGWGGLALYLNRTADVDVTGITLSEEQLRVARQRAADAGVGERVRFELIDYRRMAGRFDRIVSVGMFEHVGSTHYASFFAKSRALLADDGVMLLHTIGRMGKPGTTDAFTAKYIFPGGYNPALSEIIAASQASKLIATDVETLRLHYAMTLEQWYERTVGARARIEALYDERFYRMWTFYLAGAISAFRWGGLVNYQVQYTRDRRALPITRNYMIIDEQAMLEQAERGLAG